MLEAPKVEEYHIFVHDCICHYITQQNPLGSAHSVTLGQALSILHIFYAEQSKINPSVLAFEQELENILLKLAKQNSSGDGYQARDDIGKRLASVIALHQKYILFCIKLSQHSIAICHYFKTVFNEFQFNVFNEFKIFGGCKNFFNTGIGVMVSFCSIRFLVGPSNSSAALTVACMTC